MWRNHYAITSRDDYTLRRVEAFYEFMKEVKISDNNILGKKDLFV